jgi:hypothetical protein
MAMIQVPGSNEHLDPDHVAKVEIRRTGRSRAVVDVFLKGAEQPKSFNFNSYVEAIKFYEALWSQREAMSEVTRST